MNDWGHDVTEMKGWSFPGYYVYRVVQQMIKIDQQGTGIQISPRGPEREKGCLPRDGTSP